MRHFSWYEDESKQTTAHTPGLDPKQKYQRVDHPAKLRIKEPAFHGVIGQLAREIESTSEADQVAILVQLLVCAGNIIGRSAHALVEGQRHYLNLFTVLVGDSSRSRKGSSWSRVRQIMELLDEDWLINRQQNGLVSSEGLVYAVRDPIHGVRVGKVLRPSESPTDEILDPGISDKRLLSVEEEFVSVIRHAERSGNTLSPRLREAWDSSPLKSLAKRCPDRCHKPHISIIGHITPEELQRTLGFSDIFNGFANRFLWVSVYRSKLIPDGETYVPNQRIITTLLETIAWAKNQSVITRDQEARKLWASMYPILSDGRPGLVGAVIGRAEAQVLRLSTLYAVLDHSSVVCKSHLQAALALWDYCEQSAYLLFGNKLGDVIAERILAALRQSQMLSRTEIMKLFNNNKNKQSIDKALQLLKERGMAIDELQKNTGGGPKEIWKPTK